MSDTPEKAALRKRLREAGEPCGWTCNSAEHFVYYNLPQDQKDLMMLERQAILRAVMGLELKQEFLRQEEMEQKELPVHLL